MGKTLFILNDPPYGSERCYNALRLAAALSRSEGEQVRLFLLGDAVSCAKAGQRVPQGFYNVEHMRDRVARTEGGLGVCGTCMDARAVKDGELLAGAHRSSMDELTRWTQWADKVMVF
ncbi:MAG TPA: DsrE family protein [Burkholderiales bacterium]|nr:DsrE family protein [Burkholderiales bacterium]